MTCKQCRDHRNCHWHWTLTEETRSWLKRHVFNLDLNMFSNGLLSHRTDVYYAFCILMYFAAFRITNKIGSTVPMYAPENCVLLTLERSLSTGPAAVSVTGRSLLLRLEYGTVCRLTWENRNCHMASSGGLWRHFYSDSETTAHCELLNCAT